MGFLKPKVVMPPPPPPPEPVPEAPEPDAADIQAAEDAERARLNKKKNRKSTILTSMMGDETEANINTKTLLG